MTHFFTFWLYTWFPKDFWPAALKGALSPPVFRPWSRHIRPNRPIEANRPDPRRPRRPCPCRRPCRWRRAEWRPAPPGPPPSTASDAAAVWRDTQRAAKRRAHISPEMGWAVGAILRILGRSPKGSNFLFNPKRAEPALKLMYDLKLGGQKAKPRSDRPHVEVLGSEENPRPLGLLNLARLLCIAEVPTPKPPANRAGAL